MIFIKEIALKQKAGEIAALTRQLERDLNLKIIINDRYLILKNTPLGELENVNAWHLNPYCLKIKSNRRLHARCVYLKRRYDAGSPPAAPTEVCCYCGVKELAEPVTLGGVWFLTVFITGLQGPLGPSLAKILAGRTGTALADFLKLHQTALKGATPAQLQGFKVYLHTLAVLLRQYLQLLPAAENWVNRFENGGTDYIRKALDYITANAAKGISTAEVAAHCHLSQSYLQHLFVKQRGHGVGLEIRRAKLTPAAELLCTTNRSVREIALTCGYHNSDYFSTAFRAGFGQTPLQYRRCHRRR